MSTPAKPRTPTGLGPRGRRLWRIVTDAFELTIGELEVLTLAARALDRIAALEATLADAEAVVEGSKGQPRANPLCAELRAEVTLVAALLKQLALPSDDHDGGTAAWSELSPSARGRRAARARWDSRGSR